MTPRNSLPVVAISFALLGLVAWMATAHPAGGRLYADRAAHVEAPPAHTAPLSR